MAFRILSPVFKLSAMTRAHRFVLLAIALAALGVAADRVALVAQPPRRSHLVVVVDGLRPDYVTAGVMPRLYRLGRRGVVFTAHHSVFPTVTRVNASSFVTGAYPETHGLLEVTDNAGRVVPNAVWSSSAAGVAPIDPSTGMLTALSGGQTTITATAGALMAQATITVSATGSLPGGSTRWSIEPLPNLLLFGLTGVSSVDTTNFASIDTDASGTINVIRGFTVDGQPTWTVTAPIPGFIEKAAGDVDGGILMLTQTSERNLLARVDPVSGSSWSYAPLEMNPVAMAQAPDGTIYVTTETMDGSSSQIVGLDGLTGQQKFTVTTPSGVLRTGSPCDGPPSSLGSYLSAPVVDATGIANVMVATSVFDRCYNINRGGVAPQLDVSVYRIAGSGALTVVPLHHYDGLLDDTGQASNQPYLLYDGFVLPDDEGGVAALWFPCGIAVIDCATATAGRYVNAAAAGDEYALSGIGTFWPPLSGANHRGYISSSSLDYASDAVSAFDMKTGQMFWSVPFSDGTPPTPIAALEGGSLQLADSAQSTYIFLDSNGSTIATQPTTGPFIYSSPIRWLGDAQIGVATDYTVGAVDTRAVVSGVTAFFDEQAGSPAQTGLNSLASAEKCTDDPQKEQLRQEYIGLKTAKIPSCRNFVNDTVEGAISSLYQFGSSHQAGTWLVDADFNWALASRALASGVTSIMQQYGEVRRITAGYRNPSFSYAHYPQYHGDEPHTQGIGADFTVKNTDSGAIDKTIYDRLRAIAKNPDTTGAILSAFRVGACVEPWALVTLPNVTPHFHVDGM